MAAVAFYISGHGFGHASRQIEIINALGRQLPPGLRIVVRTASARWLFDQTLRARVTLLPGECDTGLAQIDSLRPDADATTQAAEAFYQTFEARAATEAALLKDYDARLVIADAPPLACAAAGLAGIPSIVISNFTWDWIYEAYEAQFCAGAPTVLPRIREAYARASAGWRLPMHGGFATIASVTDLPFVARHATRSRDRVRDTLQLPADRPLALTSFGGFGLSGFDPAAIDCRDEWTVVMTGRTPPAVAIPGVAFVDEGWLYNRGLRYEDLVAAVDVVVTKPGYGITSECVANGTAMLYT
ncbi:MAG: hypothetical protein H0W08_27090, partial [Acidobacteria bacterium]|nr:hypothetical protein [Acidobacteriota bacterium]